MRSPIIEIVSLRKNYHGLRPLRIESLIVHERERVAISGLDAPAAETLINLITAAATPDEGHVRLFGKDAASLSSAEEWLSSLDRVGIVTPRAVFLEGLTVLQNLALPLTIEIDPPSPETVAAAKRLAAEMGLPDKVLGQRMGEVAPQVRARVHVGRALALDPAVLLLEHPTVALSEDERAPLGADVARCARARGLTVLALSQDSRFTGNVAERTLVLHAGTGALREKKRGWW